MNFTLYISSENSSHVVYMFHFVDGKIRWAWHIEDGKRTDVDGMTKYLHEAKDSGLPAKIIADDISLTANHEV